MAKNDYASTTAALSIALENISLQDRERVIKQANRLRDHCKARGVPLSMIGALEVIHSVGNFLNANEVNHGL